MKSKLSPDRITELLKAYDAWNPNDPAAPSSDELAAQFGVSKQTMYNYVKNRKRSRADERHAGSVNKPHDELAEAHRSIAFLTAELMAARAMISSLEQEIRELQDQGSNVDP